MSYYEELLEKSKNGSSDKINSIFMLNAYNSQLLFDIIKKYCENNNLKEDSIFAKKFKNTNTKHNVHIHWNNLPLELKKMINVFVEDVISTK